jgi:hypothetical protein
MPPSMPPQQPGGSHDVSIADRNTIRQPITRRIKTSKTSESLPAMKPRRTNRSTTNKGRKRLPRKRAKEESDDIGNSDVTTLEQIPSSATATATATTAPVVSSLDANGLSYGGGICSSVSPYGMMPPSPYMGMGMGMGNTTGIPYFSGIYQIVYGVQNLIFSISQVIQVVGTNQQALQHAWESLNQMIDHAVATFNEMRALECIQRENETEEEERKRKRLKALRYALVFGGGWLAYKLIRNLLFRKRLVQQRRQLQPQSSMSDYAGGYPGYTYHGGHGHGY